MNTRSAIRAMLVWAGAAVSLSAGPVLTLTPSGDLIGTPGTTVGWGFTITNDADYAQITSAQYCVKPVNFPLVCNSSALGIFTDFIGPSGIVVGPPGGTDPSSVSQNFDTIALTGIGSFAIDNAAPIGAGDLGQIVLTYNLTTLDPNDPNAVSLGTDLVFAADASITVSDGNMPEPGTAGLMLVALAVLAGGAVIGKVGKAAPSEGRGAADSPHL
jgi:hypothetical protein